MLRLIESEVAQLPGLKRCILPLGLWALFGVAARTQLTLVMVNTWWLYLAVSLAFGAVAFNEMFPIYVALIPVAVAALMLSLNGLSLSLLPRGLPFFLIACGLVTGMAWSVLLWMEMQGGTFPPQSYYTVRTTYALDLGIIALGCMAAGLALLQGLRWGAGLALSLLSIAALLLPMMVLQTIMQLRAGVSFGPEAAAPFVGFSLISAGAIWFLVRLARVMSVTDERAAAP